MVVPVREGLEEIGAVLRSLLPQARETGAEVIVVGRADGAAPAGVRLIPVDDHDIYRLRMLGAREARGVVVAIGEDHAVPWPDWCAAVLRAHAERPEAAAVSGCLVNATDSTLSGRSNFLAFAAPYQPPMASLPGLRPPPLSALSFKRESLSGRMDRPGSIEGILVPELFAAGTIAADDRIVVDHYQDHGVGWSIINAFRSARSSYGYRCDDVEPGARVRLARWSLRHWPQRTREEARAATGGGGEHRRDLAVVAVLGLAFGLGGAVGSLAGPGRAPERVA